jgi:hypothetical protein
MLLQPDFYEVGSVRTYFFGVRGWNDSLAVRADVTVTSHASDFKGYKYA